MSTNTNQPRIVNLNPDPLGELEKQVRDSGTWAHVEGQMAADHFFVSKNPKTSIVVSLCGQVVVPLTRLRAALSERKCMVCYLWKDAREEVPVRYANHVAKNLQEHEEE